MSRLSPCAPWCTTDDLPDGCDDPAVTPETMDKAIVFASDALYNLTGRRWPGLCTDTFRPMCGDYCNELPHPTMINGHMANVCGAHEDIRLPAIDVVEILEVKINGTVIDSDLYFLRNRRSLVAKRGADGSYLTFPCYNDPHALDDANLTWSIKYSHGASPPPSMVTAAAIYAWEFALGWTPNCAGSCRLPKRVTTVTRAGMTFAILDPLSVFDKGMTGVPDVDALIKALAYGEAKQRAYVGRPGSGIGMRASRP